MKGVQAEVDELKATVARLAREVARLNQREAHHGRRKDGSWLCKPKQNISKGATDTVTVYAGEESLEIEEEAKALGADVSEDKWCLLWYDPTGRAYVSPLECD